MTVGGTVDFGGAADDLVTGGDDLVTDCDGLVTVGDGLVTGGDVLVTDCDDLVTGGGGLVTGAVTSFLGSTVSTCQRWGLAMETKMNGSGIKTTCRFSVSPYVISE
jgi:hypothetical protein